MLMNIYQRPHPDLSRPAQDSKQGEIKSIRVSIWAGYLYASMAWSQCAPGVPSAGNPGCIPPDQSNSPYYQENSSQQQMRMSQPIWADRWGAIAIDSETGGAGTVAGRASKADAIQAATSDCMKHGATHCKIELAYYNQCAAIAWGSTHHGVAGEANESLAQSSAMKYCRDGATDCKVVYSACSLPERIK